MTSKRDFARDVGVLDEIFEFLGAFIQTADLGEDTRFTIDFVVEELFTNMVKYGGGTTGDISISVGTEGGCIRLELVDPDADPFDPSSIHDVDVTQSIANRQPGGLGLHLIESMVDDVSYDYQERQLKITVIKKLEP